MQREKYTASVITRVTPRLKAKLEAEAKLAGVKSSAYTRKILEGGAPSSASAVPSRDYSRAHGLMQIRAELRRQGGLMKMLIVEYGAPRPELNPVIRDFVKLIDMIDQELKTHE